MTSALLRLRPLLRLGILAAVPVWAIAGQTPETCPAGETSRTDLGIQGLQCVDCSVTHAPDGAAHWRFSTEPVVHAVRTPAVAAGLRDGDRLVALDGHLITSESGTAAWAALQPGDSVRFRVRRGDEVAEVRYVAGRRCDGGVSRGRSTSTSGSGSTGKQASGTGISIASGTSRSIFPSGYLGVGLSCACRVRTEDGKSRWSFDAPPEVTGVAPGGPADRAGIRVGDRLVSIDGIAINRVEGGRRFSGLEPNDTITLEVSRDGTSHRIRLTTTEPPGGQAL